MSADRQSSPEEFQTGEESDVSAEAETGEAGSGSAEPATLPLDQVFGMVKNERRRRAISYLKQEGGQTTLGELAEHIAAMENDKPVEAVTSKERKRVYVGLYQCHLPKMDDLDIVDFDQNRGTLGLGPNAERLYPYVDTGDSEEQVPWPRIYLGLAVVAALGLAGTLALGMGSGPVPALIAGGLAVSVLACSTFQLLGGQDAE
jgi:hypothetical protein